MHDFVTHTDSYIAYACSSTATSTTSSFSSVTEETESALSGNRSSDSAHSGTRSSRSAGMGVGVGSVERDRDKEKDKEKDKEWVERESISWSSVGGYDHPQPGSRLLQYGKHIRAVCCLQSFCIESVYIMLCIQLYLHTCKREGMRIIMTINIHVHIKWLDVVCV